MDDLEPIYQRAAKINSFLIRHTDFDKAMSGILECMHKSVVYKKAQGCLLTADGGHGKTLLCKAIVRQLPTYCRIENRYEKTIIPAFYAQIPSPASVKSVAGILLKQLGDPNPLAGNTTQMTLRLCHLLKQCETQLVFLDEFHHLFRFQKTATKLNTTVCDWIKSLVNETQICFCLVGLPAFASLLKVDEQLARRFQYHYSIKALSLGSADFRGSIFPFLVEVEKQAHHRCEIVCNPKLDSTLLATQIYVATAGNPAFIMSLIQDSMIFALKDDRKIITPDDFSQAWQQGTTAQVSLTKNDPFKMSRSILASQLRGRL